MGIQVVGHTSFIGHTGYNNHSRNFFTNLNNYIPTRVRNYTTCNDLSYLKKEEHDIIIKQKLNNHDKPVGTLFTPDPNDTIVNLVLNESNHYFFYDKYDSPMIAYNVWESTRQLPEYFNRVLEYDQFWCPTEWQRKCTIDQGYPADRVKVVPEGLNPNVFLPGVSSREKDQLYEKYDIPYDAFVFMIFGRWDYRKATAEMVQAWYDKFKDTDKCYLVLSADNPFSSDGMETTEERLKHYKCEHERIKVLHFPDRSEYIKWMQYGACLISCSRSEGWNLPLMEAIACGTPTICSDWGGHLEFADGISHKVNVFKELPPKQIFMVDDVSNLGVWGEPDFGHLKYVMRKVYKDFTNAKINAMAMSKYIRKLYTWDNAARTADKFIRELVETISHPVVEMLDDPNREIVKLNLGCGTDIREGYINIDKYDNTGRVDHQWDIGKLEVEDNSVDEIFSSHVFEHIPFNEVYSVLEEWHRVLRSDGKIVMYLPDLEADFKRWLNTPDDRKWFELHHIFGGQTHKGNFHFNGHNQGSLKWLVERFGFDVTTLEIANRGYGNEIYMVATKANIPKISNQRYNVHFVDGPFAEILGSDDDKAFYVVDFFDVDENIKVHRQVLNVNNWTRPHRKYFTNWNVKISRNGKPVVDHTFDCKGKKVLVSFDSKSLGDTIAWIPQVEAFRRKHECELHLATFWNRLFVDAYPDIQFIAPGQVVHGLYATYKIGCWEGDLLQNKVDWRKEPLQHICSNILGMEHKEIVCNLGVEPGDRPIEEKYVAISEFSTFQCKFWNYPDGWQQIVNYLNEKGYKVVSVSKEETKLENVIKMNNKPIEETITNIAHAEFFIGISSGPAWLAWALKKPVVLISGSTEEFTEFESQIERVINTDVCHGCINDVNNNFDRGDWGWCPRHKGTDREFECTKKITPDMVINAIDITTLDVDVKETEEYFYVPPKNKIQNLNYEVKDFKWDNFRKFGPVKTMYQEIFKQDDYSYQDCKIERGDIVVDLGANIGVFTRYAFLHGAERILSFEPEQTNFKCLLKNKPDNCEAFMQAVSDTNDEQTLFVSRLEGSHTLVEHSFEENQKPVNIQCITLNKIFETHGLEKIDFLKLDIEGSEIKVFNGITDENLMKIRKISLEYHHEMLKFDHDLRERFIDRFVSLGFKMYKLILKGDCTNMLYFWQQ